ncbi:helix-turn-helix domain-containing protein [Acinetobacter sp. 3657]|uniref:TetR/AcrR family transcriptional regulator n=1 Tax=Acinetobacter sp. 3657 TaxID=2817764 RepID=UPI00285C5E18|nr:AcrR family transcriptional regulator [Prolinoborus sp. 3657]
MARNKRIIQNTDEKKAEIIAAARMLFLEVGYDATSMSKLATTAKITPNTIYWYFKDKDEVLTQVLSLEFIARLNEYHNQSFTNHTQRLLWVIQQLESVKHLITTVHNRLDYSEEIRALHESFHQIIEGLLSIELQKMGVSASKIDATTQIIVFTIEGILSHGLTDKRKYEICELLM